MFENIINIFKKNKKREVLKQPNSKDKAKERLHLVLMQDRANVSADFLDLMRKEIIEVIKKYIDIDEEAMDVRLATETNEDGTQGAPALYANIPIINIKDETRKLSKTNKEEKISVEPPKKEDEEENKKEEEKEVNETKEEKTDEETELEIEEDNELVIEEELDSEKEENTKEEENAEPQEVTEEMKEEKKNEE